jgi:hypothetical protein
VSPLNVFEVDEPSFHALVQRQWSNQAAHAGHRPCVPAPPRPYFNVTLFPDQLDTIQLDGMPTSGFRAAIGEARRFQIGFISDAPVGPWAIHAVVNPTLDDFEPTANGTADIRIDKMTGQNGEKANIVVTPKSFSASGVIYVKIVSVLGDFNYLPLLIGEQ